MRRRGAAAGLELGGLIFVVGTRGAAEKATTATEKAAVAEKPAAAAENFVRSSSSSKNNSP